MSNLIPHNDYILIEKEETNEKTSGGIIIPETARENSCAAIIKRLGKGFDENRDKVEYKVKPGDEILIQKHTGIEVGLDDSNEFLIKQENIIAILKDKNKK